VHDDGTKARKYFLNIRNPNQLFPSEPSLTASKRPNPFRKPIVQTNLRTQRDNIFCFVQPRTSHHGKQCSAQFPEGVIINAEEREIISLNQTECSHMLSQHYSAGCDTSKNPVCDNQDNQETETYVHWHLSSYLDLMTDKQMTFDEFIADQRIL
jgi:hypothetical protein